MRSKQLRYPMADKKPRDTTPHEPSDKTRAEVSALVSFGVPQEDIAAYIDIDAKTLRKYYRSEIDKSVTTANAAVAKFLYNNASGKTLKEGANYSDCVRAAMFWAKTRMKWRETGEADPEDEDAKPLTITFQVKPPAAEIKVTNAKP